MKFGFFMMPSHSHTVNPTLAFEQDLRLIEYAESLGFDEFWVGEHHWGDGIRHQETSHGYSRPGNHLSPH